MLFSPPNRKKNVERAALLRFLENLFLRRHLGGHGIEIGALWRRFPVPPHARVWHVDRLSGAGLEEHYPALRGRLLQPDLSGRRRALACCAGWPGFLDRKSRAGAHAVSSCGPQGFGMTLLLPRERCCSRCRTNATPSTRAGAELLFRDRSRSITIRKGTNSGPTTPIGPRTLVA